MANNVVKSEHLLSIADLIAKKRDDLELNPDEIKQFIDGLSNGDVQDCHVGAMLMAIYLNDNFNKFLFYSFNSFEYFRYDRKRNLFNDNVYA
jgi:hypothetical protein